MSFTTTQPNRKLKLSHMTVKVLSSAHLNEASPEEPGASNNGCPATTTKEPNPAPNPRPQPKPGEGKGVVAFFP
jgi:hypothetical protein